MFLGPSSLASPAVSTLRRLWARPLAAGLTLLALPFVVLAVRAVLDDAPSPSGDVAIIEVRVGDVFTSRHPLLGSYGRFGFNHPGPLLFYALAVPYRLVGGRAFGLELGALLLGGLSVACIARVAYRRGGRTGLLWALVVLGVLVRGVGPAWLVDPWEPHVLPLVAAALFALSWDVVAGRPSALPWAAAAASLVAQAWATMLPVAVALGGWAAAGSIVHAGRSDRARRDVVRAMVVATIVVAVAWAPPVLQELSRPRGNLSAMVDALDAPEPALGAADGWRAVSTELGHRASWLGFPQALDGLSPTLDLGSAPSVPGGAVALAVGFVVAVRRRRSSPAWLVGATAGVMALAATFALARLLGPIYVWIPQWLRVVGMVTWFAAGWCAAAGAPDEARARARVVVEPALAFVAVVLLAWATVDALSFERADDPLGSTARRLVDGVADELAGIDGTVLLTSSADANLALGGDDVALEVLVLAVEDLGVDVAVPPSLQHQYGPERAADRPVAAEVRLARADDPAPPGFTSFGAALDPLSAAQRATRAAVLERAGLPEDASDADFLRVVVERPELRDDAARLRAVPDLPELRLLRREVRRQGGDDRAGDGGR